MTPPAAAIAGWIARRKLRSSPRVSSYCSSTETEKKKIASRPSDTQCASDRSTTVSAMPMCANENSITAAPIGELAITSPAIAAISSRIAGNRAERSRVITLRPVWDDRVGPSPPTRLPGTPVSMLPRPGGGT